MTCNFGNSLAGKKLDEILINHPRESSIISAKFSSFGNTLSELEKIDSKIAIRLGRLERDNLIDWLERFDYEIKNFAKNVFSARYRIWFKKQDGIKPYKNRKQ